MNGHDKLFEENTKLSDLGIVSGDLLHIILNDDELAKHQAANPAPSSANPAANPTPSSYDERMSIPTKVRCVEPTTSNEDRFEGPNTQSMDLDPERNAESEKEALQQINRYLNEPMLCRDATVLSVPASLQQAYVDVDVRSRADAVCVLLHVLMTECGYQVGNEQVRKYHMVIKTRVLESA